GAFTLAEEFGDRVADGPVPGTAAQVTAHRLADLVGAGALQAIGEDLGRQDHARGAEPALDGRVPHERLGRGLMERRADKSLQRLHLSAVDVAGEEAARADRRPVDQHGAGPADLALARLLDAGEPELLAQEVEQQFVGGDCPLEWLAIDDRSDGLGHGRPLGWESLTRRHQAIQYSSVNSSVYLVPNSSLATGWGIGTVSPSALATNCSCAARSRVIAAHTAHLVSSPTT